MNRYSNGITNIFAGQRLDEFLDSIRRSVFSGIDSEKEDYILNVNERDYILFKSTEAKIENINIDSENITISSSEKMIPAKYFSGNFFVTSGNSYKKDVIKFHIPFSGNKALLNCQPNPSLLWTMGVEIEDNEFSFEIINFNDDANAIKKEKESNIQSILQQCTYVILEVDRYNSGIEVQVKNAFDARKKRILATKNVLSSLGIPIRKLSSPATTFSIPAPQKRKKISLERPTVVESGYTPEPSLDDSVYREILNIIHDVGREFERLPSLYAGKEEEHLRDHFLMMLEPNFEGSATGETFNKTGKTDILLRYKGTNVFIGECKFWSGQKNFLNTITQLLGYLTWRDSKAAVILFVPNKDFSSIISTTKACVIEHPNFLKFVNETYETWLNYEFHLNGDRNRVVKLAVMLYHIPR